MTRRSWFRNEPLERPSSFTTGTRVEPVPAMPVLPERRFTVTGNFGGFTGVSVTWEGTSREDVRATFMEFLLNDEEFGIPEDPRFRSLNVIFHGRAMMLTFRRDWVSGFTIV